MFNQSEKLGHFARKTAERISTGTKSTLDALSWVSERTFTLIKLFAAFFVLVLLFFIIINLYKDRDRVSVKPFSVPEGMQKTHQAAGSIIANIIKQTLTKTRMEIDSIIEDESHFDGLVAVDRASEDQGIVSHDNGFFRGENIRLPETGISINDIVEFLSGLFGRRNITGSVYEDNETLYLQIEMAGDIFSTSEKLDEKDTSSDLNIDLIRQMASRAATDMLSRASEKYRVYFFCTDANFDESNRRAQAPFKQKDYQRLYELCYHVNSSLPNVSSTVQKDLESKLVQENLSNSTAIEQFVFLHLGEKIKSSIASLSAGRVEQSSATISQVVETHLQQDSGEYGSQPKQALEQDKKSQEIAKKVNESELLLLKEQCSMDAWSQSKGESNRLEERATNAFKIENFEEAKISYLKAIRANCKNPYAWANLGVLLSDLRNKEMDPLNAAVAFRIALDIKPQTGWIWHSLCVAEAYHKTDKLEEAINNESCRIARSMEPAKNVLYDKLFFIAVADKYRKSGRREKAFIFYKNAIEKDPKRTCRLNSVVERMELVVKSTKDNAKKRERRKEICTLLENSYPVARPDLVCEESLSKYQDDNC